jgi:hypothetical protein
MVSNTGCKPELECVYATAKQRVAIFASNVRAEDLCTSNAFYFIINIINTFSFDELFNNIKIKYFASQ